MHLTRVTPCDQVKPELHNEEERIANANARKAYCKTRGRLHEIGQRAASHLIEGQDEAVATPIESVPQRNRKRKAVDDLSELGQLREGGKRQRSGAESSFAVPTLSLTPPLSPSRDIVKERTADAEGSQLATEQRRSKAPRLAPTEDLVKIRLVEVYNHLNEQILVNERAVKDSLEFAGKMMATDKTTGMELRGQIEELRVSIGREKEKRDVALAALVSYDWGARHKEEELELLVNSAARPDMPGAQQTFHEKCAFLASELKRNGKELLALQYEAHSPEIKAAADAQRSAKKLGDIQATRARLENELQEVYMCLLRSSRRIRSLVKVRSKQP
ncbi:hypothetical protein BBJ28_00001176 [Nothophytophthora sp. Chile5]|nr:hypothetical protein BBJ28_00001176 [Nothophytophthora sp. Chile5]